jgi:hypothetical protein
MQATEVPALCAVVHAMHYVQALHGIIHVPLGTQAHARHAPYLGDGK